MALAKAEIDRSTHALTVCLLERKVRSHPTTPLSLHVAQHEYEKAQKALKDLWEIHTRIAHTSPADIKPHEEAYERLAERIDVCVVSLMQIISEHQDATNRPQQKQQHIKLPDINLPMFSGCYDQWPEFEDIFTATIDSNSSLSSVHKLQYLKSCTSGEAHDLIKSFTITNGNYEEAWKLLTGRYKHKREIVYSLIRKFLHQHPMKGESVTASRNLLNTTLECIRSLKVLGRATEYWDDLLVVCILDKVDTLTKSAWENTLTDAEPATLEQFTDFLEKRVRTLAASGAVAINANHSKQPNLQQSLSRVTRTHHSSSYSPSCPICKKPHAIYACAEFPKQTPYGRMQAVKKANLCMNCLREGHTSKDCKSKHTCKKCSRKHNTMLHFENAEKQAEHIQPSSQQPSTSAESTVRSFTSAATHPNSSQVLLKTAIVLINDSFGNQQQCRALLDDGSEASFITENCAKSLGLPLTRTDVIIEGVTAQKAGHSKWIATATLHSTIHKSSIEVEVLLLPRVTGTLPRVACNTTQWTHLVNLQLADPTYNKPGDIDILLGADVVPFIMKDGRREGPRGAPVAQNSIFGWVLSGKVSTTQPTIVKSHYASVKLDQLVQRMWTIEEVKPRSILTKEEAACEAHFSTTITRNAEGRYICRLPFHTSEKKPNISNIGNTRALALSRLYSLEKRFQRHPTHHEAYIEFMREYIQLGHMKIARSRPANPVYIPHHFVIREDSSTTKLRVVFDGSMKSSNSISLNSTLMVGPTIQSDLVSILVRFRLHPIALKADIAKMYRQYQVHPEDRDYQRILWREREDQPVAEYQLNTVTYGTACAPYLATRCLKQLATDEQSRFPRAAAALHNDMYVDDLLSGEVDTCSSISLVKELIAITAAGGMSIRKWCSNSPAVMQSIPEDLRETGSSFTFEDDAAIKALGISWEPTTDTFTYYTKTSPTGNSKRELLSEIAKVFDPLGWITPITITAKILFQETWQTQQDWDTPISTATMQRWRLYQQQLSQLNQLHISRCIIQPTTQSYALHGFSDSSEKAYGACVYLKCTLSNGTHISNLVAAKTKVAPIRQTSLARLELCAAVLLSELIDSLQQSLKLQCSVTCYTDSMIVLKWLSSTSRRWKTYVANRVAAIQEVVEADFWHHVSTHDNPADLPSRGTSVEELINSSLWWHGPPWLVSDSRPASSQHIDMEEVVKEERSAPILVNHAAVGVPFIKTWIEKFSCLQKLITTTAVLLMFTKHICKQTYSREITPFHRELVLHNLIRHVQKQEFAVEIKQLTSKQELQSNNKLLTLCPFIDSNGLLRVGGRLNNSNIPVNQKHPILLPKTHHLTTLIIRAFHVGQLHAGPTLTRASLQQKYWIVGAKDTIRFLIRKCTTCRKAKAEVMQQQMSHLPENRVIPHRPFLHSGVDFAGPFSIKMRRGRGSPADKCYFAIFVCLATKAVHLEAVTSLTSEAFIACFRRFTS